MDDNDEKIFPGYEVIITIEDIEKIVEASNDMEDLPTEDQIKILYQINCIFLQNLFFNQLYNKKTGKLNLSISKLSVDYQTLKTIQATMVMKQVNEFTFFDYFNYTFKNDLEGASTEVNAYEPEYIFDALGFTIRNLIVSMDLYKAVESGKIYYLLETNPDGFVTQDNLNSDNVINLSNVDGDKVTDALNNILATFDGVYKYINLGNAAQDKKIEVNTKDIKKNTDDILEHNEFIEKQKIKNLNQKVYNKNNSAKVSKINKKTEDNNEHILELEQGLKDERDKRLEVDNNLKNQITINTNAIEELGGEVENLIYDYEVINSTELDIWTIWQTKYPTIYISSFGVSTSPHGRNDYSFGEGSSLLFNNNGIACVVVESQKIPYEISLMTKNLKSDSFDYFIFEPDGFSSIYLTILYKIPESIKK